MKKLKMKSITSLLMALVLICANLPIVHGANIDFNEPAAYSLSDEIREQAEELLQPNRQSGAVGFESIYAIKNNGTMTPVVVELAVQPAQLEKITREYLSKSSINFDLKEAEKEANSAYSDFIDALDNITGGNYELRATFDLAFNGAALTVADYDIDAIAALDMVYAVYPDPEIKLDLGELHNIQITESENFKQYDFENIDVNEKITEEYIDIDERVYDEKLVESDDDSEEENENLEILSEDEEMESESYEENDRDDELSENEWEENHEDDQDENEIHYWTKENNEEEIQYDASNELKTMQTQRLSTSGPLGSATGLMGMTPSRELFNIDQLHAQGLTGRGVAVAVIDTGIDYNHPEFAGSFATSTPSGDRSGNHSDGYFYGRNYITSLNNPSKDPMDDQSHGTHVAGTIGAKGLGETISALGMAPDVTMAAYKVITAADSIPSTSHIGKAAEDAVKDGFRIMSMSLGYHTVPESTHITTIAINNLSIQYPDAIFVICAGNTGPREYTLWSPSPAPFSITVANGQMATENSKLSLAINGSSTTHDIRFVRNDWTTIIEETFSGDYVLGGGKVRVNGDNTHNIVLLPNTSGNGLGTGTAAEIRQLQQSNPGCLEGSIVVMNRGQSFDTTVENLSQYNAGGFIIINNDNDDTEISFYQGRYYNYMPVFTIGKAEGNQMIRGLSYGQVYRTRITDANKHPFEEDAQLYINSSRGPVVLTYDIKPDITAIGTGVLSPVPLMAENVPDYEYAYSVKTGTSMATPHISGIIALMRQKYPEASAYEIKAKLMNTADPMAGTTPYDTGAGLVNPLKALSADSYALAQYDNFIAGSASTVPLADAKTPSLNFGMVNIEAGSSKTLDLHVYSESNRNYVVSVEQNEQNPSRTGLRLSSSSATVSVRAGGEDVISITVAPENLNSPAGTYTGFVNLTDGSYKLRIPFAVALVDNGDNTTAPLNEAYTFLHKPVISTGSNKQISNYTNYNGSDSMVNIRFKETDKAFFTVFVADENGTIIGETNKMFYGITTAGWDYYWSQFVNGKYYPYSYDADGIRRVGAQTDLPEGAYKLMIYVFGGTGSDSYYLMDFYVDNTLPEIQFNNFNAGSNTLGYTERQGNMVITGNIYDEGTADMIQRGIHTSANQRAFGMNTSQKDNIVVMQYNGNYYRANIDVNGDFSISVPKNNSVTTATIWYGDHFLPAGSELPNNTWNNNTTTGFNPNRLSYRVNTYYSSVPWMDSYAYSAANMDSINVRLVAQ